VVLIYSSFPFPGLFFLLLKVAVIFANFLLLAVILRLGLKMSRKIALIYIILADVFIFGVCVYDVLSIAGVSMPQINYLAGLFFRSLGLL
jgi:hypothetical protein